MISRFLVICLCIFATSLYVECYPSGAGGCKGGKAAVGGTHKFKLIGSVAKKTLAEKKVKISVGGVSVLEGKTVSVAAGKSHTIKVNGTDMKGILVRVKAKNGVSTKSVLTPGSLTQAAKVCASPVVGITHKSNDKQKSYTGTIKFQKATSGVILDITVVFINSLTKSEYAYGQLKVDFV